MEVFAFCTLPARRAVREATGVEPFTSPPTDAEHLPARRMENADLIYFRLHGSASSPLLWSGEGGDGKRFPAFTPRSLEGLKLKPGAVVVIANCYGDTSPLARMFYQAGAGTVIAGEGSNYAEARRVVGADRLVKVLLAGLRRGLRLETALRAAKLAAAVRFWRKADRDTKQFHILGKTEEL